MSSAYSCSCDDSHNPDLPAQVWFQHSEDGETLFVVFYSQACRWHRCLGCNLWSRMSSHHIGSKALLHQIDNLMKDPDVIAKSSSIKKIIVSNNGSILDRETFSATALRHLIVESSKRFKNLSTVSIETRPEYVKKTELDYLQEILDDSHLKLQIEIAIGFEAFDDKIRNAAFHKGLKLDRFERFVHRLSKHNYSLKCYFMQKPVPDMTDEEAVEDIKKAVDYLNNISESMGVKINIHLNPTYVAKGTLLEEAFNNSRYVPPQLMDVVRAVSYAKDSCLSLFVGLSDEGLAVEGGSFIRHGDEKILAALDHFNATQDYSTLAPLLGIST
jgi:radical SAM enzyme (TIGR01210 family)